jgi:hypothetical protein
MKRGSSSLWERHRSLECRRVVAAINVPVLVGDGVADNGVRLRKGNSMAKLRTSRCSSSPEIAHRRLQSKYSVVTVVHQKLRNKV